MIGLISGKLFEKSGPHWVIKLGDEKSFVGYVVHVPARSNYEITTTGSLVELRIYTHVREDAFDLFGFFTAAEKELFLTLLSVNGIGPKVAMGILSAADPDYLVSAILNGDKAALRQVPGVGPKTVERILIELKDVVRKKVDLGLLGGAPSMGGAHSASYEAKHPQRKVWAEMREALLGLGYREHDFRDLIETMSQDSTYASFSSEQALKEVLKQLRN